MSRRYQLCRQVAGAHIFAERQGDILGHGRFDVVVMVADGLAISVFQIFGHE
jgi:hypothetical protein